MPPPKKEDNTAIIAVVVVCIIIIITATVLCIVGWKRWGWFGGKKAEAAAVPVVPAADTNAGTTVTNAVTNAATEAAVNTVDTDTNTGDDNDGGGGNNNTNDGETQPFTRAYTCWENDTNIKRGGEDKGQWWTPDGRDKTWRPNDGDYTYMCNKNVKGCKSSKKCFGKPSDWVNPTTPTKEEDVKYDSAKFRCTKDGKQVGVTTGNEPNSPQANSFDWAEVCQNKFPKLCIDKACKGELY